MIIYKYITGILTLTNVLVLLVLTTNVTYSQTSSSSTDANPALDSLQNSDDQEDINLQYNTNLMKKFSDPMVKNYSNQDNNMNNNMDSDMLRATVSPKGFLLLQNRSYANSARLSNSNIGEDVSNTTLALTLTARDVMYSLNEKKYFTLHIKNISPSIFTINLADDNVHNVFLDVYDDVQQSAKIPTSLLIKRTTNVINYRSITLYPNENFSLEIELNEFADISEAGMYRISARFYPDRFVSMSEAGNEYTYAQKYIESSPLLVSIVSVPDLQDDIELSSSKYTDIYKNSKLITREYNPNDVVQEALTSLVNNNWNGFFSHINLVKLYTNTLSTSSTYNLLSVQEQQKEIIEFMKRLESGHQVSDFYPPASFEINETRYTSYNASIHVTTRVIQKHTTQLFKYNFILEKEQNAWKIVNYTVQYIGVESYNTQKAQIGDNAEYVSPTEFR